jgi:hypothetical protein
MMVCSFILLCGCLWCGPVGGRVVRGRVARGAVIHTSARVEIISFRHKPINTETSRQKCQHWRTLENNHENVSV